MLQLVNFMIALETFPHLLSKQAPFTEKQVLFGGFNSLIFLVTSR